ncbi:hypothetical protein PPYR_14153 [Photinus pyralis]|uniref:Neuromodulin n=2 Tax=Photinus pyralis TaxID=7054 RepID=A0A5N4A4C6_PHOPY|nr:neuromodulin [Photinus pyralis]KAB0792194.1 hypothetical protein PPYR_14153 [Photinus pyralis]
MGCNTSKDTALQPPEEAKDKNENDSPKVDGNNVDEITETKEEKPPSAKTITLQSETADGVEEAVDLTDPDLAGAATKIQAAFRGHQTRRTMKHEDKAAKSTGSQQQQQQQHQQEEFENDFGSDDVELTHAATKIQASFRGHMVRKQMDKEDGDQKPQKPTPEEEELDIDLTDPELNKAATKIQASFRGHAVRKDQPGQTETK